MTRPWWLRMLDWARTTGWLPVHSRTNTATWWTWRHRHYRLRERTP